MFMRSIAIAAAIAALASPAFGACEARVGKACNKQVKCCPTTADGVWPLECRDDGGGDHCEVSAGSTTTSVTSTTLPSTTFTTKPPSSTVTTATTTTTSTTAPPALGWVPDTWRPTCDDVSLGSTSKLVHPRTGDVCDQRCLSLRVEKRLYDCWPEVIRYLQVLPGSADIVRKQLDPTGGLAFVISEINVENPCQDIGCPTTDGQRLEKRGTWPFGPDYDWNGNVGGRLQDARSFVLNAWKRTKGQMPTPPENVRRTLDVDVQGGVMLDYNPVVRAARPDPISGPCERTGWCRKGRKLCTSDRDCVPNSALRDRSILTNKVGCRVLTDDQERKLAAIVFEHGENGRYRKEHGEPRPGGADAFDATLAAFEATARDPDELSLFTLPHFQRVVSTKKPKPESDYLEDRVHAHMIDWANDIRLCPTNPAFFRIKTWFDGKQHEIDHVHLGNDFGPTFALRVPCTAARAGSVRAASTLDGCPNLPFPPPGFYEERAF